MSDTQQADGDEDNAVGVIIMVVVTTVTSAVMGTYWLSLAARIGTVPTLKRMGLFLAAILLAIAVLYKGGVKAIEEPIDILIEEMRGGADEDTEQCE